MNSNVNSQELDTNIDEVSSLPVSDNRLAIWEIFSIGGTATFTLLFFIFLVNSALIIGLELIKQIIFINPKGFGYIIYFLNWIPLLNLPIANDINIDQLLISCVLVSLYQILFITIGSQYNPKSEIPWWNQFKTFQFPDLDGILLGAISLITTYLVTIFIVMSLFPIELDKTNPNITQLNSPIVIAVTNLINPITSFVGTLLNQNFEIDVSIAFSIILLFILVVIISSILIQLSIILIFEEWKDYEGSFLRKITNLKNSFYEGTILYLAFPVTLIMFLLGGSIFIFFPVLVFNFITNGALLLDSGAFMTQILELLILSTLLLYPAYAPLTWGQYYKHRLLFGISNKNDDNINNKTDEN